MTLIWSILDLECKLIYQNVMKKFDEPNYENKNRGSH